MLMHFAESDEELMEDMFADTWRPRSAVTKPAKPAAIFRSRYADAFDSENVLRSLADFAHIDREDNGY